MKKIIIILIVLLSGALLFSAIIERRDNSLFGDIKTRDKNAEGVPAKSPSGFMEKILSPEKEIKEILTDKEEMEKTAEEAIRNEEKVKHNLQDVTVREDIKDKGERPAALVAEAPTMEIKRMGEVSSVEKEMARPAVKKETNVAEETSGRTEKIVSVSKDEKDITKPADKRTLVQDETPSLIIKDENKVPMLGDEIKLPVKKTEEASVEPPVFEEKKETMPAGGLIVMTQETPAHTLTELLSMRTKNIVPEREEEQPVVKMEAAVAGSRSEKAIETKEVTPPAGKKEEYMEKPEHFSVEMLKKGSSNRVAIFPFENLSNNKDAFKHVLPLLIDKLGKKGFEVVDEDDLNNFLCEERIRSDGYISRELSGKIRKRFNISTILTGTIVSFSTEEIPQFGVLARMIDPADGTILWADYSAATGEDFIAILELGRLKTIFSLIPKVIDILFASFKVEEFYTGIKPAHRIAVMPFKNNTSYNNAGIIAMYMFMVELLKSREFMPIEYGDVRDMIIKLGIRRKGDIGYDSIGALSKELKTRGIVVGVVDNYSAGESVSEAPHVGITARLVDGSNNKILWYNSYQLSGEDNIVALDWGRIRSVHSVAFKAISGLVKEMRKKKWPD